MTGFGEAVHTAAGRERRGAVQSAKWLPVLLLTWFNEWRGLELQAKLHKANSDGMATAAHGRPKMRSYLSFAPSVKPGTIYTNKL